MLFTNNNNSSFPDDCSINKHILQQPDDKWNHTTCDFPHTTLDALFEAQATKTPNAPALMFENTYLSYQALDQASNQVAHLIREHYTKKFGAFKPDTPIALFLDRSFEMMIGLLGILKAGGAYVPIDPKYPAERVQYILEDTNTQLVLTQQAVRPRLHPTHQHVLCLDEKPYAHYSQASLVREHEPRHLAYILYTSGTTGKPKGVAIPHQGIVNRLDWMQRAYPLTSADVVLQKTPYCFDVSVWELLWAHQVGALLVIAKPNGHQDPLYLHTLIKEHRITTLHFVPSMLTVFTQALADANEQTPTSLRYVFCSGEALTKAQVDAFYAQAQHNVEVHNLYGPTEASIDVTFFACTRNIEKVYIGKPIQNTQIYILDAHMQPAPIDEAGELYIGGVGLAREYWNKPELTKERFVDNPFFQNQKNTSSVLYKTGDLAKWTSQGNIEYLGRNDFQVKIRGFRIELGEIEHVLTQYPGIHQSIVLAQEQQTLSGKNSYLVAYYISDDNIATASLVNFLQSHLPEYMIPSAFIALETFPLTSNGKLDRSLLPQHDFAKAHTSEKPRTPLEEKLATIWASALGLSSVGITDHFLSLGGHSLIAARIISMIKNTLHKTISFADFYRAENIEHLAALLETLPTETKQTLQTQINTVKKLPLTDFQLMLWLSHIFEPKAKKMNILMRKRLQGHLDIEALYAAFNATFKKHEALYYRISKIFPTQKSRSTLPFAIERIDNIQHLASPEDALSASFKELLELYPWPKQYPFVLARVFYLPQKQSELQLCMPHLIADERSMEILCEELSAGYLTHQKQSDGTEQHPPMTPFRHYLQEEQQISNTNAEAKIKFWENYLQDARLLVFPKQHIVSSMQKRQLPYSTYVEIPEEAITKLKAFCTAQRVTISDAVSSALSKALAEHQEVAQQNQAQPILINLIKSTRETLEYDRTIGCFVRVDPMKVHVTPESDLKTLSKQIHNNMLETAENQRFSSLLKFACFMNCFDKKSWIKAGITRLMMPLYIKLIQIFKVQYESYKMFELCWRLASFKRKNLFLVNLNLWNNFVNESQESILFGMPVVSYPMSQYELLTIDFILDICFIRDDASKKPYLVISCNLTPEFKTSIAKRTIELMTKEMAE